MEINQETHKEYDALKDTMARAREWMSCPWRTREEIERWYPEYKRLTDKLVQVEESMWGPLPWEGEENA